MCVQQRVDQMQANMCGFIQYGLDQFFCVRLYSVTIYMFLYVWFYIVCTIYRLICVGFYSVFQIKSYMCGVYVLTYMTARPRYILICVVDTVQCILGIVLYIRCIQGSVYCVQSYMYAIHIQHSATRQSYMCVYVQIQLYAHQCVDYNQSYMCESIQSVLDIQSYLYDLYVCNKEYQMYNLISFSVKLLEKKDLNSRGFFWCFLSFCYSPNSKFGRI